MSPLYPSRVALIESFGGHIETLDRLGAVVHGIDLSAETPPPVEVIEALELEMAHRGFIVFRNEQQLEPEAFLRASRWWGGKELHSTHGVHRLEKQTDRDGFRLLDADEVTLLCHEYNDLLNDGLHNGYAITYEYHKHDCVFIDNLAVAHRAAPEAHRPVDEQGLRIMHGSTVRGVDLLKPRHELPLYLDIHGPNPAGGGVWQGGGVGFRWEAGIPMQN